MADAADAAATALLDDDAAAPAAAPSAAAPTRPPLLLGELRAQAALALPLAFTLLCRFAQGFVDLAVVGHLLGTDALAGASLALTFLFALTNVVTSSCGDATAALCAQALGAGEPRLCQTWLQLGMLSSSAVVLVALAPAWAFVGAPLRALGAGERVAQLAEFFARASIPRMLLHVNYYAFKMFLAAQRRLAPDVLGNTFGIAAGVAANVLLVGGTCAIPAGGSAATPCWPGLGFAGAPLAGLLARALVIALVVALAIRGPAPWRPASESLGGGWMLHAGPAGALRGDRVRHFLALALPSAGRAALDQGVVLGLALLAGSMGAASAGAHNALVELFAIACALAWAIGDAVMVRVGRALGAGDAAGARRAAAVGVAAAAAYAALAPAVLVPLAPLLGTLFSRDAAVLSVSAATAPAMAALVSASALLFPLLGVATAQGASGARGGARAWLAGAAVIVPMAWGLGISRGLGVPGLWAAWAAGYGTTAAGIAVLVARADWDELAAEAAAGARGKAEGG